MSNVNMQLIWVERNICTSANWGKYPDNVMIHPVNKENLLNELMLKANIAPDGNLQRAFGMRVIWTTEIDEHEVVCTYNGYKRG